MAPRYGIWKPLPEAQTQARIRPTQMIAHSIVGSARSAYNYFRDGTNIESHFIMTKAGEVWQLMESDRQADANYKANRWANGTGALSMETEDNRDPDRDPWTEAQLNRLIDWFCWGHDTFAIPLTLPSSPAEPGIGYHTLFPNHWTNAPGKTCPGVVRKEQFHDIILPALRGPAIPKDDDDMDYSRMIERRFARKHGNLTGEHLDKIEFWSLVLADKKPGERANAYRWVVANEPALK